MPKKVNLLPNERVDIVDLSQASQDYAQQLEKQLVNRGILDKFSRIGDGFRIEIPNQGTSPGSFTVHNGVAYDRSGQIVNNEDDLNTSRSITLNIDGTYFVEVQFTSAASDVDARAFWDPTFDNGADPSGDARPPGREFSQNIATRLSPDWQIVTPVSTTGFELSTNPNSTRIPLAVIVRSGGVITGSSTVSARSILSQATVIGVTSLKVFDSRLMPNAFTGTVGAESITVTSNDKENGILTLSGGTGSAHSIGERIVVTGATPTQYLVERTAPLSVSSPLPIAGPTVDARPRLFQGDEERGAGLLQNPHASTGVNDVQLKALRDYVDFVAGQIRDIRWGSPNAAGFGAGGPPAVLTSPRYYNSAGGLQGARAHTVSVGDGVTSWGDYNVTGFTTSGGDTAAKLAIQAAINSLTFFGGTVYLKQGTYTIGANPIIVDRPVYIIGDGKSASTIVGPGSSATIQPTGTTDIHFEKISITQPAGATISAITAAVSIVRMSIKDCTVTGVELTAIDHGYFSNVVFNGPSASPGAADPFDATLTSCYFEECDFNEFSTANSNCLNVRANSLETAFYRCKFSGSSTSNDRIVFIDTNSTRISFQECILLGGFNNTVAFRAAQGVTFLTLRECYTLTSGGLLAATNSDNTDFLIENCQTTFTTSSSTRRGIDFTHTFASTSTRHKILNCRFVESGVRDAINGIGIYFEASSDNIVEGCIFQNCDVGIFLNGVNGNIHKNNKHFCDLGIGRYGEQISDASASFGNHFLHNTYLGMSDNVFTTGVVALYLGRQTGGKTIIDGCEFISIGQGQTGIDSFAIYADTLAAGGYTALSITNCWLDGIQSGGSGSNGCEGIHLGDPGTLSPGYSHVRIIGNYFHSIGTNAANNFSSAISISKYALLVIANNTIESIGHPSGLDNAGIVVGWQADSTARGEDYTITGNVFRNIAGAGTLNTACIEIIQGGLRGVISNNVCEINNSNVNGIAVTGDSSAAQNGSITITGNVIEGNHPYGIEINQPANKGVNRRYVVSNNIIRDSLIEAIHIDLGDDDDFPFPACTVSGNIIESGDVNVFGIVLIDMDMATVSNNSISLPAAVGFADCTGILFLFCRRFACTGNVIFVPSGSGAGDGQAIRVDNCATGTVSGNQFIRCYVTCANGGKFWVVGNQGSNNTTIISVVSFDVGGAVSYQTARGLSGSSDNSGTNPASLSDIWLNLTTP